MHIEPRDGEIFDQLLHRLTTSRAKAGILREYTRTQRFRSNGELQREKV
jgi:ribosomal protein S21